MKKTLQKNLVVKASGAFAFVAVLASTWSGLADTLNPLADTYVQSLSTANNSTSTSLLVKNQFGGANANNRVPFLKFDGSDFLGGNVQSASLTFTLTSFSTPVNMTFQLFGIPDGATNENFNAATITYANSGITDQSADNNVNDTLMYGGAPLATASLLSTAATGTQITFSGANLISFLDANTNSYVSFILTTTTQNSSVFVGFGSSENTANEPVLNFTLAPVPEPSTIGLAALGSLGIFALRRRRE
ncbi:MAG TPA: PEP-CTERM sorting domain-containing protein [Verrucomicrobiae bacterium]|jgi:hypothetical protein